MSYKLIKPYTKEQMVSFKTAYNRNMGLKIEETSSALYALEPWEKLVDDEVMDFHAEYETELAEKERERIQSLSMTRSDFFDGTIKAFGADSEDLLKAIEYVLGKLEIADVDKKVALNNYKNALNFYRKHPLFTMLADVEIPVSEGVSITISSEQWDRFFDETDKKNPEAYKELLPVMEIIPDEDVNNFEETDNENSGIESITDIETVNNKKE